MNGMLTFDPFSRCGKFLKNIGICPCRHRVKLNMGPASTPASILHHHAKPGSLEGEGGINKTDTDQFIVKHPPHCIDVRRQGGADEFINDAFIASG